MGQTLGYSYDALDRHYVRTRHLDTGLGRWLSPDPIGDAGGWPVYGYVGGGPVGRVDATGLLCWGPEGWVLVGAAMVGLGVLLGPVAAAFALAGYLAGSAVSYYASVAQSQRSYCDPCGRWLSMTVGGTVGAVSSVAGGAVTAVWGELVAGAGTVEGLLYSFATRAGLREITMGTGVWAAAQGSTSALLSLSQGSPAVDALLAGAEGAGLYGPPVATVDLLLSWLRTAEGSGDDAAGPRPISRL